NLRPKFLSASGLSKEQVFNGGLYIAVYQVDRICLPIHPPTNPGLLEQADFAYRQPTPIGLFIDDSAREAAQRFAALYNASGISQCIMMSAQDYSTQVPAAFPIFMACHIAGWVTWKEFARDAALWTLTAAAVREIQDMSINGAAGQKAGKATTTESLINSWRQLEEMMLPLDFLEFNRFHHGGKVFEQDVRLLEDCIALGNAEGKPMSALK